MDRTDHRLSSVQCLSGKLPNSPCGLHGNFSAEPAAGGLERQSAQPGLLVGHQPEGLAFNIEAGTKYRVAVDGYGGATGGFNFEINTSSERLPTPVAVAPNTRIAKRKIRSHLGIARFVLTASEPGTTFLCKLDSSRFKACGRAVTYRNLKSGRHVFRSKAVGAAGLADPTPVRIEFKISRRP